MNRKKLYLILLLAIFSQLPGHLSAIEIWTINSNGSISWNVTPNQVHSDHIEMSGKKISTILRYGVKSDGSFTLNKSFVFPSLRTIPNNTHASLNRRFNDNALNYILINGNSIEKEQVESITLKGIMTVKSHASTRRGDIEIIRKLFPSTEKPAFIENIEIKNKGNKEINVEIANLKEDLITDKKRGVSGSYKITTYISGSGSYSIAKGESVKLDLITVGGKISEPIINILGEEELKKRESLINLLTKNLILETPSKVINTMFAFSKIRACESIYETKNGPMHGPGGESYYAAIWANDQAEYINPYFPFIGYDYGNKSAINSYMLFARYMNKEWSPIPSSIVAEGEDIWDGAGDRGDAAMIAYGAARYALMRSSKQEAEELMPLIEWCLEYCNKKINSEGVVKSDCDELENRFPAGEANLCTSTLYYDALISASYLNNCLHGNKTKSTLYIKRAKKLRNDIDKYFGKNVEGFDTYQYYKGNDVLRSWICIPLTVGINERAQETTKALFSKRLWTKNGLLTQAGSNTFWDRSTLYALRGIYYTGMADKATEYLQSYSQKRLLCDHVPYAIEAWPEGNQRHLSAESALYGRIITEGLFGIRPIGFNKISITPHLPNEWDRISLNNIGTNIKFDIEVIRESNDRLLVKIIKNGSIFMKRNIKNGSSLVCNLK